MMLSATATMLTAPNGASGAVPLWMTLTLAVVPLGGAVLAYRQATKATKATKDVDNKKVDAEAYKIAKGFYEDMLAERKTESSIQQAQILQLNERVLQLQESLNAMQQAHVDRITTEDSLRIVILNMTKDLAVEVERSRDLSAQVTTLQGLLDKK
jgi:hypothetical protein